MRLINADILIPSFIEKALTMEDHHGVMAGENWLLNLNDIKDVIDNAPSINIPIRFKGEWIEREQKTMGAIISYNVCSYCHMKQSIKWKFCPDCGADMRKGDES